MTNITDLKSHKGHTSIFWNSRSLYPKLEEIDRIIDDGNPDIIGITESWLNTSTTDNRISFDGYNLFRLDRITGSRKRGGGGLVLYYEDGIKLIELTEFRMCDPDLECLWVQLHLVNTKRINIGLIYRPPSGNINNFIQTLEDMCLTMRTQYNCEISFRGT